LLIRTGRDDDDDDDDGGDVSKLIVIYSLKLPG
jgi:hypothetical protein